MNTSEVFPDDENGEVLLRMQRDGDDLTKPRDIDFSIVFPTESAAVEFADHFRHRGFKVSVKTWDGKSDLPWDVTITQNMLPAHAGISNLEEAFEFVAAPLGGRNDGWGCFRQLLLH